MQKGARLPFATRRAKVQGKAVPEKKKKRQLFLATYWEKGPSHQGGRSNFAEESGERDGWRSCKPAVINWARGRCTPGMVHPAGGDGRVLVYQRNVSPQQGGSRGTGDKNHAMPGQRGAQPVLNISGSFQPWFPRISCVSLARQAGRCWRGRVCLLQKLRAKLRIRNREPAHTSRRVEPSPGCCRTACLQ